MAIRRSEPQNLHDSVVENVADRLVEKGWDVYAHRIDGYYDPTDHHGYIPDISAHGSTKRIIVEIETDTSDDSEQRAAFKQWAQARQNRDYYGIITNPDGDWEIFESA